jgi:NADH-quinone oxidoreductase subunit L
LFAADGSGRWTRTDRLTVAVPVNPAETDESAEVFSSVAAAEPGEPAEPAEPSILEGLLPEAERPPVPPTPEPDAARATRPNKPARVLEAPRGELLPLVVLAALSCVFGFLGLNRGWFAAWLGDADGDRYRAETAEAGRLLQPDLAYHLAPGLVSTVLAVVVLILGFGIVYAAIRSQPADDPARILGPLRTPALHGFFADRAQDTVVVRPVEATAVGVGFLDREVVDGYVRGTGLSARALGGGLRRVQNGNVQLYLTGVLTGVVVIAAVLGFGR